MAAAHGGEGMGERVTQIRRFEAEDMAALYEICLKTALAGADASAHYRDGSMPGHVYAAPYLALPQGSGFVAEDDSGVAGYIVGVMDTRQWEATLERDWWPKLRRLYADPAGLTPGERNRDKEIAALIHHPNPAPSRLVKLAPAHIHMNLLPRLRRQGWGAKLLETWLAMARSRDVKHLHLGASRSNAAGVAFWISQRFEEQNVEDRADDETIWMARAV